MADGVRYVRRVRRGFWEQEPFAVDNVLADFYDESVRAGTGLSLWRVARADDANAATAILAIGDKAPSKGPVHVIDIPAELLAAQGLAPQPTPGGTSNSHKRAPELHHDVMGSTSRRAAGFVPPLAKSAPSCSGPSVERTSDR